MNRFVHIIDIMDRAAVTVSQIALFTMMSVIFISIVGRSFFGVAIPDTVLLTETFMVFIVFLSLGHLQKLGGHLEVSLLADRVPPAVNRLFVSTGLCLGIVIFGAAAWFSGVTAWEAYMNDETFFSSLLDLREWPVRALVPIGLIWWALRMFLQLFAPIESGADSRTI